MTDATRARSFLVRTDCRHYRGDRPCHPGYVCTPDCDRFEPVGRRVLLVKCSAMGDVVRTTPFLRTLPRHLGPCQITWITDPPSAPLLRATGAVDRVWTTDDPHLIARLSVERFDLAICLDKSEGEAAYLSLARAPVKRGFGLGTDGMVHPVNPEARYLWRLGLDDEEKFYRNQRTYPELAHEAVAVPYDREPYVVRVPEDARERARTHLKSLGVPIGKGPVVGIQTGSGDVFAHKSYTVRGLADCARKIHTRLSGTAVLLGGPGEEERSRRVAALAGEHAVDAGTHHDILTFAGIIGALDVVVTGDTLAMHLAIGLGIPVVAIFGSTCPQEIDLFDRGEKIVTPAECHPCYRRTCDITPSCMDQIPSERVIAAVERWVEKG